MKQVTNLGKSILHEFCRTKMVHGSEKIEHYKNCNFLPNLFKLIEFGVIAQNHELHKILDYFSSAVFAINKEYIFSKLSFRKKKNHSNSRFYLTMQNAKEVLSSE